MIGFIIAIGVELDIVKIDKQQSGRVVYVSCLSSGSTLFILVIIYFTIPKDEVKNRDTERLIFSNSKQKHKKDEEDEEKDEEEDEEDDDDLQFVELQSVHSSNE